MRLSLHLDAPTNPKFRLPPDEQFDYNIVRLIQLTRWTWEEAERFITERPDKARRFFDAIVVQRQNAPKGDWFA